MVRIAVRLHAESKKVQEGRDQHRVADGVHRQLEGAGQEDVESEGEVFEHGQVIIPQISDIILILAKSPNHSRSSSSTHR